MVAITLSLPEELASQVQSRAQHLQGILELGLREFDARGQSGFEGAADIFELLAALPTPEEVLSLRPAPHLAARVAELVEKSRAGNMTAKDQEDWDTYEYLEHLVRMAKAAARLRLSPSGGNA
jgi:hypothetical protein